MIDNILKQQIIDFVKNKPIELVYLFGSRMTGDINPHSDYDFAVKFAPDLAAAKRIKLKLEIISMLSKLFHTDKIDLLEIDTASPALQYHAFCHRGEIFFSLKEKMVDFEIKSMAKYFDFQFYLKRHTTQSIKNIAVNGLL